MPARGRDLTQTARHFMFGEAERFVSHPRLRFGPHLEFKDKLEQYNPNLMAGKGGGSGQTRIVFRIHFVYKEG